MTYLPLIHHYVGINGWLAQLKKIQKFKMFLSSLIEEIFIQIKFLASKAVLNYVGCQLANVVIINLKNINILG